VNDTQDTTGAARQPQLAYSELQTEMQNEEGRRQKARKIVLVTQHFLGRDDLAGVRALDIGCSTGFTAEELSLAGADVTGIDIDELYASVDGVQVQQAAMRYRKYVNGHLRADGKPGFNTPTGRFEVASEWFRAHGYDPLPVYTEPTEGPLGSPGLAREFPLVLSTGARIQSDFRSQHHNIPSLVAMQPWPLVQLHAADAAARGIGDGDDVDVATVRGRLRFRASVSENIVQGVVECNMGGGGPLGPQEWRQTNVNELTDPANFDQISGFPVYKALLCEVYPAETATLSCARASRARRSAGNARAAP